MARKTLNDQIDDYFRREEWEKARRLLEREWEKDPDNHWLLTQLGVTYYEQQRYEEALPFFQASLRIVRDCPLTLWNLAGTLNALGKNAPAIRLYTGLLQTKKSPEEDPCWESKDWTDALKADCVYRLGVCFQDLGKKRKAEHCYRQYLNLLSIGINGLYTLEDVQRKVRDLHGNGKNRGVDSELHKAIQSTLLESGIESRKSRRKRPPVIDPEELATGQRGTGMR